MDENGSMVIVKNPTVCGISGKSGYVPAAHQNNGSVGVTTMAEVEEIMLVAYQQRQAKCGDRKMITYKIPVNIGIPDTYWGLR